MSREELKAFLELLMCSDPNPVGEENDAVLKTMADRLSAEHGFENWIVAYHEL